MRTLPIYKKTGCCIGILLLLTLLIEIELKVLVYALNLTIMRASTAITGETVYKIYCFGDSYTFGDGAMPKDSYPRQLERLLNAEARIKFKVFNLGIPGANSSQALSYMKYILTKYAKPDLVIIRAGVNDCWNFSGSNFHLNFAEGQTIHALIDSLTLYTFIENLFLNIKSSFDWIPSERDEDNALFKRIEFVKFKVVAEYNLSCMVKFARARGIRVVLQNYPGGDIYGPDTIFNVAGKLSVPFVDNFQAYNEKLKAVRREDIFAPYWSYSHPNGKGYKIMAEEVVKAMRDNKLGF